MEEELFDELLESVKEAAAISRGEQEPSRVFYFSDVKVKSIREKAGLTQNEMAKLMSVSVRTLQNWEQGRRRPTGPAAALIRLFEKIPKDAIMALKNA